MRTIAAVCLAAVATIGIGTAIPGGTQVTAQVACLHGEGEAPDQITRRQAALGLTRHINSSQAQVSVANKAYQPLAALALTRPTPVGFIVKLSTDGDGYSFSVVDQTDPCRFGYFSNQDGVIYKGEAIR
jgi:hypothetical protein